MDSVKTPKRNGLFLCIIPFFLGKCRKTKVGQIERKSRNVKKRKQAAVLGCGGLFWKKGTKYHKQMLWAVIILWVVVFGAFFVRHMMLVLGG